MNSIDTVSIVIPVYNSTQTLGTLTRRLTVVLEQLGLTYEVILVNDGSCDESWERIVALSDEDDRLQGISLMRNYGQHNALLCGIQAARYEVMVTLDDDLQNPPEEIPKLLAKLAEGYHVVYGMPRRAQHGIRRDLA